MQHVLKVNPEDNVGVALTNLSAGQNVTLEEKTYHLPGAIAAKHKFALVELQPGDPVHMYGVLVGKAPSPSPGAVG